jgi:hypothetical protein
MTRALTTTAPRKIDGPNHNELERMEFVTDALARSVRISKKVGLDRASLDLTTAEELLQLLSDGLRTAKQLKGLA